MEKHFVFFLSPGTFVHEQSVREIETWDVEQAKEMARNIKERYGSTPFAFYFITRSREDNDLDSKITQKSPKYYLGGKIETVEEVRARNDPKERILLSNMEGNRWKKIITNSNSWKITQPLEKDDVVLEWSPNEPH